MVNETDILHKTTYVWKEKDGFATVIKNDGGKIILNKQDTIIWKNINDDDSVKEIYNKNIDNITIEILCLRLEEFIKIGIVSNEDMFWEE